MSLKTLKSKITPANIQKVASPATDRIRGSKLQKTRQRIAIRDQFICQTCGKLATDGEVDHETPLFMGGAESDENRKWRCPMCHKAKSEQEEKGRNG
jgi:5-methylcytosine-specific restriction enzyme A